MQRKFILINRAEGDSINFFENAFRQHFPGLCLFANRYVKDKGAAEDIAEETFIKLWNNRASVNNRGSIKSWLYRTAKNACIDYLRKEQTKLKNATRFDYLQQAETESYHLQEMIRAEMINELYAALQQLPNKCRTIFSKLYIEGKGMEEAARELNLSINTIKSQKARGLKLLRNKLSPLILLVVIHFL